MNIEYEATFTDIDKESVRKRLRAAGAQLVKPEFMQKRLVFNFPAGYDIGGGWIRVRDEGDKITMSIKVVDGTAIENQKELQLEVNSFEAGVNFLKILGCKAKAYQESKREIWELDGVEIMIDEWPFLEPLAEIEGPSKEMVRRVSQKIGFEWSKARFCAVGTFYSEKYGLPEEVVNNQTPRIVFEMENPFIRR